MTQNTTSLVYSFYEPGVEIFEQVVSVLNDTCSTPNKKARKFSYKCKICGSKRKADFNVNSNLATHLNSKGHETQKAEFEAWVLKNKGKKQTLLTETFLNQSQKRQRLELESINSLSTSNNLISMRAVSKSEKYKPGSALQAERYMRLLIMIIKCMLPISIVSYVRVSFIDFCLYTRYIFVLKRSKWEASKISFII